VKLYQNNVLKQQTLTNTYGYYSFTSQAGIYKIKASNVWPTNVSCPIGDTLIANTAPANLIDTANNFAYNCPNGFDLGIDYLNRDSGLFRPSFYSVLNINIYQFFFNGSLQCPASITSAGGTLTVTLAGPITYVGAAAGALIPTVNGNVLTYTIADFSIINYYTSFRIRCLTNANAIIGSNICFTATIATNIVGDANPLNNTLTNCCIVTNSYDPNDKEVYPAGDILATQESLTYTIRFQNTGNAEAYNVTIIDTLDYKLDLENFGFLGASHPMQLQIIDNVAHFIFVNINLPDSNTNEPQSHGYLMYRVKLKNTIAVGNQINNTAYIYFDNNAAVVTNTVVNNVTTVTNIESNLGKKNVIACFPNPAQNEVQINYALQQTAKVAELQIINNLGELMELIPLKATLSNSITLNIENYAQGVCTIQLITDKSIVENIKLVIIK